MATTHSQPVSAGSKPASGTSQHQAKFELGVSVILHNWTALSVAVENEWGGPDSADKRDWFAGVVVDLFQTNPLTDSDDVEELLLQVMEDEYGLVLEDESEVQTARNIMQIRQECGRGEFANVDTLYEQWKSKKERGGDSAATKVTRAGPQSDDEDSVDGEDWDEDGDTAMEDAGSGAARAKPEPEVDEDGFTKVVGKKKR